MKRSELVRRTPLRAKLPDATPKPAPGPRKRKCAICREPFQPRSMTHKACGPVCAEWLAARVAAVQKAKQQRQELAQDKIKREGMKSYTELVAEAQRAFNAFIRARDDGLPCICCGRSETTVTGLGSHGWDCGHFRSTGSAPHLRFNEDNAARQLVLCNRYGAGRAVDYRIGLIARIGLERVEALEADNAPRKWTHDELRAIKAHYKQKLKELQNGKDR